ncbi:MAG: AcrR family transcriptional regulator [Saprospiraceae bacterium]
MNKTKKNIILSAIRLFNENGVNNVLNQEIADATGISLSNYNYHFKGRESLINTIGEYMRGVLEERLSENKILTEEGLVLKVAKIFIEFEAEFRFFYLETHNILQSYPSLRTGMIEETQKVIQMITNLNYMAIGMGYLRLEPPDAAGLYNHLAVQLWINNHYWFAQEYIRGLTDTQSLQKGLEASYYLMYPYLTEKGKEVYKEYMDVHIEN